MHRLHGPERGFKAALLVLFLLAPLILAGEPAEAGSFKLAPTLGDVPPGKSTATFRLVNQGTTAVTVQITPKRWTQENNRDVLGETDELLVVPPLAVIAPGQSQVVRIAHRHRNGGQESAFRVFFQEVPAAPPEGFVGVQTTLRLSVPLFFAPEDNERRLVWTAKKTASGNLRLQVVNLGNRFTRITSIVLRDGAGDRVAQLNGPQYALAGATRHWELPETDHLPRDMELEAVVEKGAVRQEFPLKIE